MEYVIGIVVALLAGLFYYKNKATTFAEEAVLADTRGQDKQLKKKQEEIDKEIKKLDAGIEALKAERKRRRDEARNKSDIERADDWDTNS